MIKAISTLDSLIQKGVDEAAFAVMRMGVRKSTLRWAAQLLAVFLCTVAAVTQHRLSSILSALVLLHGAYGLARIDQTSEADAVDLTKGKVASCGCLRRRETLMPVHQVWVSMKKRCDPRNANEKRYARYAGRGIVVCEKWKRSFSAFLFDMGPRADGMTIERIDNDGNYEPGNCRWATRGEQYANKTNVYGERCHFAKLSEADVLEMKGLRKAGATFVSIGSRFGVTPSGARFAITGLSWSHLHNAESDVADSSDAASSADARKRA